MIENRRRLRHIVAVKRAILLLLAAGWFAGCAKSSPPAAPAANSPDTNSNPLAVNSPYTNLPTHAQARLRTLKIYLGAETLDAELALSEQEVTTGMMFRTNIPESDAMLFDLRVPQRASFWMANCPESLSVAYISPDGVIQEIHHLEKYDTNSVVSARNDIVFALETKDGWFQRHHIGVGTVIETEKGSLAHVFLQGQ